MDSISKPFKKELDEARGFDYTEQWRVRALLDKISTKARLNGSSLMAVLDDYYGHVAEKEQLVGNGSFGGHSCPKCGKVFLSQQGLTGHGPKRCKG